MLADTVLMNSHVNQKKEVQNSTSVLQLSLECHQQIQKDRYKFNNERFR